MADNVYFDFSDLAKNGLTMDYFNELASLRIFHDSPEENLASLYAGAGSIRTYSARYAREPELLQKSNPEKVGRLDGLVADLVVAGKKEEPSAVLACWQEILFLFGREEEIREMRKFYHKFLPE